MDGLADRLQGAADIHDRLLRAKALADRQRASKAFSFSGHTSFTTAMMHFLKNSPSVNDLRWAAIIRSKYEKIGKQHDSWGSGVAFRNSLLHLATLLPYLCTEALELDFLSSCNAACLAWTA